MEKNLDIKSIINDYKTDFYEIFSLYLFDTSAESTSIKSFFSSA